MTDPLEVLYQLDIGLWVPFNVEKKLGRSFVLRSRLDNLFLISPGHCDGITEINSDMLLHPHGINQNRC